MRERKRRSMQKEAVAAGAKKAPTKFKKQQGGAVDLNAIKGSLSHLFTPLDKEVPFTASRRSAYFGKKGLVIALHNAVGLSNDTMAKVLIDGDKEPVTLRICAMVHPEGLNMLHHLQNISEMPFANGAGQFKS